VFGALFNFIVNLALTPFCPPPSSKSQLMIDLIREPEGAGMAVDIDSAPERGEENLH
jgi:hypothetical protein